MSSMFSLEKRSSNEIELNMCVELLEWLVVLESWEETVQATRWANTLRLS
jgi:hypothetical protein